MGFNITRPFAACLRERLALTPEQEEIALFGLQTLLYPLVTAILICLAGWLLGCLTATIEAAGAAVLLRFFAHGAHSRTPLTCALTSMAVFPALGRGAASAAPLLAPPALLPALAAGFVLTLIAVWRLAPADSPAKPVKDPRERRRLRLLSIIAACGIAAIQAALLILVRAPAAALALGLGLWWQALMLTNAGHRPATLLDNLFSGKEGEPHETFSH